MYRLIAALAAIALSAAAPSFAQVRHIDGAAIEQVALDELKSSHTPGVAVAVVSGDTVIFSHGYGVSDVETGAPVTPDMLFRLGSTTKMFTAAAVVGLALEGRLDLDAPISRYIPDLDESIGKLTAGQLLSHTSGILDEAPMFGSHDETALGKGIRDWKSSMFFAPPGRVYSYSNPGFWLAGYLAESVSGKPYADVIEQRLFRPLGMKRSTLRPTEAMTWPLSQGHEVKDGHAVVVRPAADNAASWPAGSIFSSPLDLSRWVIAFLNQGKFAGEQVLPQKLIEILSSTHAHIPGSDATYGYGLEIANRRGLHWVEHSGSRAGYGSLIRMAPSRKFAVIITANRSGSNMPKLADAICEQALKLLPESHPETAAHTLTAAELKEYAGVYANGASRYTLRADGDSLTGSTPGSTVRFTRAGDGFLLADAAGEGAPRRLVLVPDAAGRVEFVFNGGRAFRRVDRPLTN